MQILQPLRTARFLARLVLAWFALSLGVAIASPLLRGENFEVVCAGTGTGMMKLVVKDDGGAQPVRSTLDCPMCAGISGPPVESDAGLSFVAPLGHVVQAIPAARTAALVAAPLPARGPPSSPIA
jgi:hypothetical protein